MLVAFAYSTVAVFIVGLTGLFVWAATPLFRWITGEIRAIVEIETKVQEL